jgi:pyridoxamine 5'-phosphate oxidase family protein
MSTFTKEELDYLKGERRLARVATVSRDGTPNVNPVGMWSLGPDDAVIDVTGHDFAKTKKFDNVKATQRAAIVIDDVQPPFKPRGIEIRGRAEAIEGPDPKIRIYPQRIISWGIDDAGTRTSRRVS